MTRENYFEELFNATKLNEDEIDEQIILHINVAVGYMLLTNSVEHSLAHICAAIEQICKFSDNDPLIVLDIIKSAFEDKGSKN